MLCGTSVPRWVGKSGTRPVAAVAADGWEMLWHPCQSSDGHCPSHVTQKPAHRTLKAFDNANSPHWGLNPGPSVYKTDALPLSYRGNAESVSGALEVDEAFPACSSAPLGFRPCAWQIVFWPSGLMPWVHIHFQAKGGNDKCDKSACTTSDQAGSPRPESSQHGRRLCVISVVLDDAEPRWAHKQAKDPV